MSQHLSGNQSQAQHFKTQPELKMDWNKPSRPYSTPYHQRQDDGHPGQPASTSTSNDPRLPNPPIATPSISSSFHPSFFDSSTSQPFGPTNTPTSANASSPPRSEPLNIHPNLLEALTTMATHAQALSLTQAQHTHGFICALRSTDIVSADTALVDDFGSPILADKDKTMALRFAFVEWLWGLLKSEQGEGRDEVLALLVWIGEVAFKTWTAVTGVDMIYSPEEKGDSEAGGEGMGDDGIVDEWGRRIAD